MQDNPRQTRLLAAGLASWTDTAENAAGIAACGGIPSLHIDDDTAAAIIKRMIPAVERALSVGTTGAIGALTDGR